MKTFALAALAAATSVFAAPGTPTEQLVARASSSSSASTSASSKLTAITVKGNGQETPISRDGINY